MINENAPDEKQQKNYKQKQSINTVIEESKGILSFIIFFHSIPSDRKILFYTRMYM